MNSSSRAVFLCVLVFGSFVTLGCSEDPTGPAEHPSIWPESHLWSKRFGDDQGQYATAVAADASGNVIITGSFSGAVDFGDGALKCARGVGIIPSDIFVAEFAPDGALLSSERFGDKWQQFDPAVAVDAQGKVSLAGTFDGTIDFGGGPLTSAGYPDVFVAKFFP